MTSTSLARSVRAAIALVLSIALVGTGAGVALADAGPSGSAPASASISGTVTDAASGAPVADASVVVIDGEGVEAGTARAGSAGGYTVEGLAPGAYRVSVSAAPTYDPVFWPSAASLAAAEAVTLTAGEVRTGIDAALAPTASGASVVPAPVGSSGDGAVPAPSASGAGEDVAAAPVPEPSETGTAAAGPSVPSGAPVEPAPAVAPLAVAAATGSLAGTVTRSDTGAAVENVSVSVSGVSGYGYATTGADGTYKVSGLPGGTYSVFLFAPPDANLVRANVSDVVIAEGDSGTVRDFVLQPGGTITGLVTNAATGAPVANVDVNASGDVYGYARTTSDGRYTISGIVGDVTVRFSPFGSAEPTLAPQSWPDVVTVAAGATVTGIDAALLAGASISGTVTNAATGAPVQGVRVYAAPHEGGMSISAETGSDGRYTLTGLGSGAVRLQFSPPTDSGLAGEFWRNVRDYSGAELVTLIAGETYQGFDAALDAYGSVSGRVTREDTGAPVEGVRVSDSSGVWGPISQTLTAADGTYTLNNVTPGSARLSFWPPYDSDFAATSREGVAVVSGQATSGVDVTLARAGSITGKVLRDGHPMTGGYYVGIVTRVDADGIPTAGGSDGTSADGTFSITGLGPGRYLVEARPWSGADYIAEQFYDGAASSSEATLVEVKAGEVTSGIDINFTTGIEISGTVSTPAKGATATAYRWNGESWNAIRRVTAWGDYSFSNVGAAYTGGVLPAGTYTVGFSAPGYCTRYWNGAGSLAAADTFTPTPGTTQSGINATLSAECASTTVTAGTPTVTGTPQVGETLTAQPGTWAPAPVQLAYQWLADGAAISGATSSTLALTAAQLGKSVSVKVTGSRPGYTSAEATSAPVGPVVPVPAVTAGTPTIAGGTVAGQTLTASPGTWTPADATLAYQWLANNVPIVGATGSTFVSSADEVGKILNVKVTGTKPGFVSATATSSGVGPITAAPLPDLTVGSPSIGGTAKVGETLTVTPGAWGPLPVTFSYQWLVDGAPVEGASGASFVLDGSTAGKSVSVTVRGAKPGYNSATVTSGEVGPVAKGDLSAVTPTIYGTPQVGVPLTADAGSWSPVPVTLAYQWSVDGAPVEGAVQQTFTPDASHLGGLVSVSVSGSKPGYENASASTASTAPVATGILTVGSPTIGGTLGVGSPLTVAPGAWGPEPVEFVYQWFSGETAIEGATQATFTPAAGDVGAKISVSVTGTRAGYESATRTAELGVVPASLTLSASQALRGDKVTVTGAHFVPGEQVVLDLHSDPIELAKVTADDEGGFTVEITVPAAAEFGEHTVVATGESGRVGTAALAVRDPADTGTGTGNNGTGTGTAGTATDGAAGANLIAGTGGIVPIGLIVLALALLAGGVVLVRRRSAA